MMPAKLPSPAGPRSPRSKALATVFEELEEQFDHVLLDLPPVLATSEAMNLSQLADSYVLVVRQGATSESQVEAALEEMQGAERARRDPQPLRQPTSPGVCAASSAPDAGRRGEAAPAFLFVTFFLSVRSARRSPSDACLAAAPRLVRGRPRLPRPSE